MRVSCLHLYTACLTIPCFFSFCFIPLPPHLPSFFKLDFFKILRHLLYFSSSFFSLHEIIISAKTSNKCLQLLNSFNLNSFSKFRPPGLLRDPSQPPNLLLTAIPLPPRPQLAIEAGRAAGCQEARLIASNVFTQSLFSKMGFATRFTLDLTSDPDIDVAAMGGTTTSCLMSMRIS